MHFLINDCFRSIHALFFLSICDCDISVNNAKSIFLYHVFANYKVSWNFVLLFWRKLIMFAFLSIIQRLLEFCLYYKVQYFPFLNFSRHFNLRPWPTQIYMSNVNLSRPCLGWCYVRVTMLDISFNKYIVEWTLLKRAAWCVRNVYSFVSSCACHQLSFFFLCHFIRLVVHMPTLLSFHLKLPSELWAKLR